MIFVSSNAKLQRVFPAETRIHTSVSFAQYWIFSGFSSFWNRSDQSISLPNFPLRLASPITRPNSGGFLGMVITETRLTLGGINSRACRMLVSKSPQTLSVSLIAQSLLVAKIKSLIRWQLVFANASSATKHILYSLLDLQTAQSCFHYIGLGFYNNRPG